MHLNHNESCFIMILLFRNRFKIFGKLPLLSLRISDKKLQGILELIESIPKPTPATEVPVKQFQVMLFTKLIKVQIKKYFHQEYL